MKRSFRPTLTQLEDRALLSSWQSVAGNPFAAKPPAAPPPLTGKFTGTYSLFSGTPLTVSNRILLDGSGTLGRTKVWEAASILPGVTGRPSPGNKLQFEFDSMSVDLKSNKRTDVDLMVDGIPQIVSKGSEEVVTATLEAEIATGIFVADLGKTVTVSFVMGPVSTPAGVTPARGKFSASISPL